MNKKLEEWLVLWEDAVSKRTGTRADKERIKRRNALWDGTAQPVDPKTGNTAKKRVNCNRNAVYELIETQINNAIPQPKVTPRDVANLNIAHNLEGYLQMEMDRLDSETINDSAERTTLKQGTCFYLVGWDERESTPTTSGDVFYKPYQLDQVYPQPGIMSIKDAEYIFVRELVSIKKIKDVYGVTVPDCSEFKGMNYLISVYYFDKNGFLSRFGWIENTDILVFDDEAYELRRIKVCSKCDTPVHNNEICPSCGNNKFEYVTKEYETLPEDLIRINNKTGAQEVIAKAGTQIPYYKIKQLPFVLRKNVSDDTSLYGISDVDVLEENQMTMNKLTTKMTENVLKAGSFVTKLKGVNIPNDDETLKMVNLTDPNQIKAFSVQTVQANMQQDNILEANLYQMSRDALGITDSYQGKRDTTAESGKAKQVSAAQAAGRMESKRRMKDAAYADLYQLMFKFLLAYCDEPRIYERINPMGESEQGMFDRYSYLERNDATGEIFYNDRFLFGVDDASSLATNRTALWQETTNNFASGTLGNPADPQTLLMYWRIMDGLNYPNAKAVLSNLEERQQQLPGDMQQAIMSNPDTFKMVSDMLQNPAKYENVGVNDANSKQ